MSLDVWNVIDASQPPNISCKTDLNASDLQPLFNTCYNAIHTLRDQTALHLEAATLSRLIYRMKTTYRSDKALKCMEKVNRCLRNYLLMNLSSVYESFFSSLPRGFSRDEVYFPTLQMLEYVLVRTQSLSALLCRSVHTCLEAAIFLRDRLAIGHNWSLTVISLCVISRIWSICCHILKCCTKWYAVMLPFRNVLKSVGAPWLPSGYVFPTDLKSWLSMPWLDKPNKLLSVNQLFIDQDSCPNVPLQINYSLPSEETSLSTFSPIFVEDVGEVVSRSDKPTLQSQEFSTNMQQITEASQSSFVETHDTDIKDHDKCNSKKKKKRKKTKFSAGSKNFQEEHQPISIKCKKAACAKESAVSECHHSLSGGQQIHASSNSNSPIFPNLMNNINFDCSHVGRENVNVVGHTSCAEDSSIMGKDSGLHKKRRASKKRNKGGDGACAINIEHISQTISSLGSDISIQKFLEQESKKRNITSFLNDEQWRILYPWLKKQSVALKKAHNSDKESQIVEKVRKVLNTALHKS